MADEYHETITTGYTTRIINAIKSSILGLILFLASCVFLYINERTENVSILAKSAHEISSEQTETSSHVEKSLIWTTGLLTSDEIIGDTPFLNQGNYIAIKRFVETYAWEEREESTSEKKIGGSQKTHITYKYDKRWMYHSLTSDNFIYKEGHYNPISSISNRTITVSKARIGNYIIDTTTIMMPDFIPLMLNKDTCIVNQDRYVVDGKYIFIPKSGGSTYENPAVGDVRISYYVIPSEITCTAFGTLQEDTIIPYADTAHKIFYRIFLGSYHNALNTLNAEYKNSLWILRLIGFLIMWIGLALFFGPVHVVFDIIPFVGSMTQALKLLVTFLIAFMLSAFIIIASIMIQSSTALLVLYVMILIGIMYRCAG